MGGAGGGGENGRYRHGGGGVSLRGRIGEVVVFFFLSFFPFPFFLSFLFFILLYFLLSLLRWAGGLLVYPRLTEVMNSSCWGG